jgi:quinol monooxygenase YgiN
MIHVIATIEVRPGRRKKLLAEFNKNVPNVLAEEGCIEYGPTVDVASGLMVQPPLRENIVVILEKWASLAALKAHTKAPHMATYREAVRDLVVRVDLQVLEPA